MCSQCLAAGLQCEYALAKPRPSRGPRAVGEASEVAEHSHVSPQVEPELPESIEVVQQHVEHVEPDQAEAEDEPDDLGSPGFHHHHEPVELPQSDLVQPSMETPSSYAQSTGIYQQHDTSLTFPAAPQTVVHEVSHQPSMASAAMDYLSHGSAPAEATMSNFTYPPPASQTQLTFPEHPEPASQHVTQQATATHQRTSSRQALPVSQPVQNHIMNGSGAESHVSSWAAVSNSPVIAAAVTNTPSPRLTKAQQPAAHPAPRAYDDARQSSNWSTTAQPTVQTTATPAYQSPRQAVAQTTRAKSRQANRPQTRAPVPAAPPPVRPAQVQVNQAAAKAPAYTSSTGGSIPTSTAAYDHNQYSTSRAESSNNRVAYEPYSNHPAPTASNSYSGYDTYNPRQASGTASTGLANSASQTVASYSQHAQQPQQQPRQRQQPSQQSHQQHQQGYSGYSNQQPTNDAPQQQQQQQSWYGFNAANNPNSAYNSAAASSNNSGAFAGAASHTHGNTGGSGTYNPPHHRSMNLSGHTYTSIDGGEQALYDLLRNNQSG